MKKIKVKTKVIVFAVFVASAVLILSFLLLLLLDKNSNIQCPTEVSPTQADNAVLNVFENNLMQESSAITYNTQDFEIIGIYFDGIRLYLNMKTHFEYTNNFSMKINNEFLDASVFISENEMKYITENDSCLVVFNSLQGTDLSNLRLCYDKKEICTISLNDSFADKYISEAYFEEMQLNWIQFGKTSTVINCKITANIQGSYFQAEQNGIAVDVYVLEHSNDDYTFLIPMEMNKDSVFTLVSNNDNSIELRIPIILTNADLEE